MAAADNGTLDQFGLDGFDPTADHDTDDLPPATGYQFKLGVDTFECKLLPLAEREQFIQEWDGTESSLFQKVLVDGMYDRYLLYANHKTRPLTPDQIASLSTILLAKVIGAVRGGGQLPPKQPNSSGTRKRSGQKRTGG